MTITLNLYDATHAESVSDIVSFIGEDETGSFGIFPGHSRMITALTVGLAQFRQKDRDWQYLALPGGLLYFQGNVMTVTARKFLIDHDYRRIASAMQKQLLEEEKEIHSLKQSLHSMENEVLKRLWEMNRQGTF